MARASPSIGSCPRRWVERSVLVVVAVLATRTWYVEGLLVPCPVAGGSMAETLLGVHRQVTCADCGYAFFCGSDLRPVSARAVCPNCGYAQNDLDAGPDLAGDGVLLGKSIFQLRRPRRWEVVAFRQPGQASRMVVKRVVGLPGESSEIRQGDVYANGQIQRKTLPQQRALAILVHDAAYQPTIDPAPPPRWHVASDSRWVAGGGRFARAATSGKQPDEDWLEYRHWRRAPAHPAGYEALPTHGEVGEVFESPVTDVCGYNQTRPRREEDVHPVGDLLLSLRLEKTSGPIRRPDIRDGPPTGRLVIRATDGREEFRVEIDPNRARYDVLRNGRAVPGAVGDVPSLAHGLTLEVSLFDRQLLLAFDGQPAVTVPCDPSPRGPPPSRPLSIATQGGLGVEISHLRVYRDVYYTRPVGLHPGRYPDGQVRLAADEYCVLGDNSPVSEDSRTWPQGPAVGAKLLVGKPLLVHFPVRIVALGPWRFQVPDPGRIRYIR